ncbi:MAG: hypothetical protein IJ608_14245 [Lachnospiraceae bacterium]|nr:hypothetical protein [Lachnospiraceae bacterium]
MLGAKSRSICVKFREDDPEQMAAWEYLTNERGTKTYAEMITALVRESCGNGSLAPAVNREQSFGVLSEIKHICLDIRERMDRCALSPVGTYDASQNESVPEKMAHKGEITEGIADLMRQLSGEDEE